MKHPVRETTLQGAVLLLTLLIVSHLILAQTAKASLPQGNVGIGTYATVTQYKDLLVTPPPPLAVSP
jgi:hypothetical protein